MLVAGFDPRCADQDLIETDFVHTIAWRWVCQVFEYFTNNFYSTAIEKADNILHVSQNDDVSVVVRHSFLL